MSFLLACRPILFESEDSDFPYGGKGSSLLMSLRNHVYLVTANHVFENQGAEIDDLRVFPADDSRVSLPYNEMIGIKSSLENRAEFKDIRMLRIDLKDFDESGDAPLASQDIESGLISATSLPPGATLWIAGYPSELRSIDYSARSISSTRVLLMARYTGDSMDNCHEAKVETPVNLESFDGLSGGGVYYKQPATIGEETVEVVLLAGMVIRGTRSSRLVHFIDSSVIKQLAVIASAA